ncbi:hypothetical protein MMC15_003973 [Xylographa vitiligo]|nr:hypothetical protein [Xylographa vitiligo]
MLDLDISDLDISDLDISDLDISDLDISDRTSRANKVSAQSLEGEGIGTPASKIEKQTSSSTVKIKRKGVVTDDLLSVSGTIGAATSGETQHWSTEQQKTSSLFGGGDDTPSTPERRAGIFGSSIPQRMRSRSCESYLHTLSPPSLRSRTPPRVSSKSTLNVPLPTKDAQNPPRVTTEDVDDPEDAMDHPTSPLSPGSDTSDDDDGNSLFDTPQSKSSESRGLSTPLTPPSVYKPRGSFLGSDSPSPAERKSRRPLPRRFAHLDRESNEISSGCPVLQHEHQEDGSSENTLTNALIFDEAPAERKIVVVKREDDAEEVEDGEQGEEDAEKDEVVAIKIKLNDIEGEDDHMEHETCSGVPSISAAVNNANFTVNGIDALRGILGSEIITEMTQGRERCYGYTKKGLRCMNRVAKARVKSILTWCQEAHKPLPLPDLSREVHGVVELMFCRHQIAETTMKVKHWLQDVSPLALEAYEKPPPVKLEPRKTDTKEAMEEDEMRAATCDYFPQLSSGKSKVLNGIDRYSPWQPKHTEHLSVKQSLAQWVVAPLGKEGGKRGFLYMFSTSADLGPRKIGQTINIEERLREWSKCVDDVNLVYPSTEDKKKDFKHVARLERLVHTELKEFRLKKSGCRCKKNNEKKNHVEWFQAPEALILAVIDKWAAWFNLDPYEEYGDNWQLKDGFWNLDQVCTPCPIPRVVDPSGLSTPKTGKDFDYTKIELDNTTRNQGNALSDGSSPITAE